MSLAGRLLLASPRLVDPNFDLCVLLVLEHGDDGALGIIVNRPSPLRVSDALPDWTDASGDPAVVFAGGPVERDALIALGRPAGDDHGGGLVLDLHSVDLDTQPALVLAGGVVQVRIFAGYAGWSPGQLEAEVDEGAWWVVDALPDDAFPARPGVLWQQVLRRQGPPLAFAVTLPDDPTLN